MKNNEEYVVLVDEKDQEIGCEKKMKIHTGQTPFTGLFHFFYLQRLNNYYCSRDLKKKKHGRWYGQIPAAVIPCRRNLMKML